MNMRIKGPGFSLAILGLATVCLPSASLWANPVPAPLPMTQPQLQDRLKSFDPAAVAAARHYYESPAIRNGLLGMLKQLTPTLIANQERIKGAPLSDADRARIVAALDQAMADNFPLLIDLSMVAALEVLSKDELVALDTFYSSPAGQGILAKMPQVGAKMPSIMRIFAPKLVASFQAHLAAPAAK